MTQKNRERTWDLFIVKRAKQMKSCPTKIRKVGNSKHTLYIRKQAIEDSSFPFNLTDTLNVRIVNDHLQQRDYEQEIERLKEQVETLKKLNDKLIAENRVLHGFADKKAKGKGDTEIGEVGV